MPYIITTTQALRKGEDVVVDALESVGTRVVIGGKPIVSRTAVATLDEAQDYIGIPPGRVTRPMLTSAGGTIGPLPDGTVIEVEQVDYQSLTDALRGDYMTNASRSDADVVAAFNAQQ